MRKKSHRTQRQSLRRSLTQSRRKLTFLRAQVLKKRGQLFRVLRRRRNAVK